jgi:hypothetical protein
MHILRINSSDYEKSVTNSSEVHFRIKIQHAEVGNKNLIIFSYKNLLDKFCINRNNLYKKIYNITLCNFWYRS